MRRLVEVMTYDSKFADGELAERRSESARKTQVHLDNFNAGRASRPRRHLTSDEVDLGLPRRLGSALGQLTVGELRVVGHHLDEPAHRLGRGVAVGGEEHLHAF